MSSYHSSFSYLGKNSYDDFSWRIVHFDADSGETDSYLTQEQLYSEMSNGKKRLLYGTKWSEVANVKITVIKQNQTDFTVADCRNAYRWLTGNPSASWMDLYEQSEHKYSFLCTVQDVKPQKIDARTVGLNIYFESVSPWAYSAQNTIECTFGDVLQFEAVNSVVYKGAFNAPALNTTASGILYDGVSGEDSGAGAFHISDDGVVSLNPTLTLYIDNQTDDLYTYIPLDITLTNKDSEELSITNTTLNEETKITKIVKNEIIQLRPEQFILSDVPGKIFGSAFNYVWPRLAPGLNEIVIDGSGGRGKIEFSYRYPIKIGDCAVDLYDPDI